MLQLRTTCGFNVEETERTVDQTNGEVHQSGHSWVKQQQTSFYSSFAFDKLDTFLRTPVKEKF